MPKRLALKVLCEAWAYARVGISVMLFIISALFAYVSGWILRVARVVEGTQA